MHLAEIFSCGCRGWCCLRGEEGMEKQETRLLSLGQWAVNYPPCFFGGVFFGSSSLSHKMFWILLDSFLVDCEWSFTQWVRGLSCPDRGERGWFWWFFWGDLWFVGKSNISLISCIGILNSFVGAWCVLLKGIFNNVFQCVFKTIWIYILCIAHKWKKSLLFILWCWNRSRNFDTWLDLHKCKC